MQRSFGIDLIRTLAIIIVVVKHYGIFAGFNYGIYAIEYLFVISGYLIGQILFANFYATEQVELSSLKRFMMRRWFRILPLYYVAVFIKFIFYPSVGINILYYVFFLQNHFYGLSFFPETWSLVIDEWFYLGTPVILYLFMRFVSAKKLYILIYLFIVIGTIHVLRLFWIYKTNIPFSALNGNIVLHQDTLLIGVILAYVKAQYGKVFQFFNSLKVFTFFMILIVVHTIFIREIRFPTDRIDDYHWLKVFEFSLFAILVAFTLPYLENSISRFKSERLQFANKFIVWGSKLSYAIYLFHSISLALAGIILYYISSNYILIRILAVILTILLSYLAYQFVEKKFLILRDKHYPDKV